jgi:uncharacterized protein (TIGR02186 family)
VFRALITGIIILFAVPLCSQPFASTGVTFKAELDPAVIHIGAFYNGERVSVTGEIPAKSEIVIRVKGKRQDLEFQKKGRVLGILWMNRETVTFHQLPSVYLLYTANSLGDMAQSMGGEPGVQEINLNSLESQVDITPAPADKHSLMEELVKLKTSEGLYGVQQNAIHYGETQGATKPFAATLSLPPRLPLGDYGVEIFALNHGNIVARTTDHLKVDEVGFPALLSNLAFEHAGLYGILASLVAIAAGLLMGLLFRESKGAH